MVLDSIEASVLDLPFRRSFDHAAARRSRMQSVWVEARARTGSAGCGEGCPREYVTAETVGTAQAFVAAHAREWMRTVRDLEGLAAWATLHRARIDSNPAAWAAVELALLDVFGREQGRSVESLLGVARLSGRFHYSAVLGDAAPREFESALARYLEAGFRGFKIKLSGERKRDLSKVRALATAHVAPAAVRADANNLWKDAPTAIADLQALDYPFFAVEEPLRAGDTAGMRRIATACGTRIVLDESLLRVDELNAYSADPRRWIVNIRVSKMGGLLRSLELVRAARERGFEVIVGAHVGESSVLTRAGLTVAQVSRDLLIGQEGAFGTHLLVRDVVERPLMFGTAGVLDADVLGIACGPGLGLDVSSRR